MRHGAEHDKKQRSVRSKYGKGSFSMFGLKNLYSLGLMVVFISFLGFSLENGWLAITKGYIDNRNMHLPFLLGYGLLVVTIHLLIGTPSEFADKLFLSLKCPDNASKLIYLLIVMAVVSIGELILGTFLEKTCNIECWNYLWIPLHFTKYTSFPTSVGFALIIAFFEEHCFYPVMRVIECIPIYLKTSLANTLIVLLTADMLHSFFEMKRSKRFNERWRISLTVNKHRLVTAKRKKISRQK